jgi:hypothetical protein
VFFSKYVGPLAIDGLCIAPGLKSSPVLELDDQRMLNIWKDTRMPRRPDYISNAESILRMIRENLCDEPDQLGLR